MKKIRRYLQGVWEELHKVSFPSKKETWQMTTLVICVSAAIALLVSGFDFSFSNLLKLLITN